MITLTITGSEEDIEDLKNFLPRDENITLTDISNTVVQLVFKSQELLDFIKDMWIEESGDNVTYTEEHSLPGKEITNYYMVVKADRNDCDYVTEIGKISSDKLDAFRPLIKAIKNYSGHYNWPTFDSFRNVKKMYKGIVSERLIEEFSEYVPTGDDGVHTIKKIEIYPYVDMIEKLI